MQGSSLSRSNRIRTAMAFGVAFLAGAIAVFAVAGAVGRGLGAWELPARWRLSLGVTGLLAFAGADLLAIWKSTFCPLTWRRQTPRALLRQHRVDVVASAWGLDTGLAVTTFRVAAATWGALLLVGLRLSPFWVGLAYALSFAGPFMVLLWTHPVGRCARAAAGADPGLESMLGKRWMLQGLSAAVLVAGAGVLIIRGIAA